MSLTAISLGLHFSVASISTPWVYILESYSNTSKAPQLKTYLDSWYEQWLRHVKLHQSTTSLLLSLTCNSYVNQTTANHTGLVSFESGGAAYIGVDYKTVLKTAAVGRNSVRLVSKKSWTHGLFIADIAHMPGGICGTWPARGFLCSWDNEKFKLTKESLDSRSKLAE